MVKETFQGYDYIEGGVCAARGFVANGMNCGINPDKSKKDLGMIYSEVPCNTAAVYTLNKVKGAPIYVTKENLKKTNGITKAVLVNSKNANTCNADGKEIARKACECLASEIGIAPEEIVVASTGVIGQPLSIKPFENGMSELVQGLSVEGHTALVDAIMTTDTVRKEVAVSFLLNGKECRLGGTGKGSGMIHPNMATTLNFITTDVAISTELVQKALSEVVKITYNCLSIDGDTSTNDMVSVMANGLAGNDTITEEGADYEVFKQALYIVMLHITKMLAADGEGASKFLECTCSNAPDLDTGIAIAKSVIQSSLFKCAMFGEDANWGRILCAMGYAGVEFEVDQVDVSFASEEGEIKVCENGSSVPFSEEAAAKILSKDEIFIKIDLKMGDVSARAWGCDYTYDYVKINGDYRS